MKRTSLTPADVNVIERIISKGERAEVWRGKDQVEIARVRRKRVKDKENSEDTAVMSTEESAETIDKEQE